MKKLTRLLSILMLVVMCISLMSVSASAAGVVIGGNTGSSAAEEPRIVGNGGREVTGTGTYDPSADQNEDAAEEKTEEVEEPKKGTEKVSLSSYSLNIWNYVLQSYPNVSENKDQILYVLNGYADGTISTSGEDMQNLMALFGEAVTPAITAIDSVKNAEKYADAYAAGKSGETSGEKYDEFKNEYISDPAKVYAENQDTISSALPAISLASKPVGSEFGATVNGIKYKSLDSAILAAQSGKYDIVVTGTQSYTGGRYSVNLYGNTFVSPSAGASFRVVGGTYSFYNGSIEGDGFIVNGANARTVINSIDVTGAKTSAVTIKNGATVSIGQDSACSFSGGAENTIDVLGGSLTINADVKTSYGTAIDFNGGTLTVNGGVIRGKTGIYMHSGVLNYSNPNGSVSGNGALDASDDGIGAAIASDDDNCTISILSAAKSSISSSKNGAIVAVSGGSRVTSTASEYSNGKIHVVDSKWLVNADAAAPKYSDYKGAVAAIGDTEYASLKDALDDAVDGDTVILLCNCPIDATVIIPDGVALDGCGFTASVSGDIGEAVSVSGTNAQLKNITINVNGNDVHAVSIESGASLTITDIVVHNCPTSGVYNDGGTADVDGYVNDSTMTNSTGFEATGGSTKVHDCMIDCPNPFDDTDNDGIAIDGGSFKFDSAKDTKKKDLVDAHIIKGATGEQEGDYYAVAQNLTSITLLSGYDTSADPAYFWYFKSLGDDNADMSFESESVVDLNKVTATGVDGTKHQIFITLTDDVYTIDADEVSELFAGSYTLRIPFVKGNYCDIGLKVYSDADVYCYNSKGDKLWHDKDKTIPLYDASQKKAGRLEFSDKPLKVGITYNAADLNTITWLDDIYFNKDGESFTLIQEDLNKLPAGLNYVVLKYDDDCIFGAQIYVKNVNASISPETLKWSTLVGDSTFTVSPDIKTVKFDGNVLTKDVDYTINKAGKLIVKGSYLKGIMDELKSEGITERTEHKLLVETSKGNVVSTITIGEDLKNNGVNYHIYGGTATLSFIGSSTIDFESGIWIGAKNPVQVPTDYVVKTTGTTFSIKAEYLNKLTYGTYTIGAYVDGTYCTTTFLITSADAASYVANTGDTFNAWIWIAILLLVAVIFFVILLPKIKGSKNKGNVPEEIVPDEDTSKKD